MRSLTKKIIFFVIALLLLLALLWLWRAGFRSQKHVSKISSYAIKVTLTPLRLQQAPQIISAYGRVISPQSIQLSSINSSRVQKILFAAGEKVRQGQKLFILKPTSETSQLAALRSTMITSRDNYQRYSLVNRQSPAAIARSELEDAKDKYQQAQQAYESALAAANIVAPQAGIVSAPKVAVGDVVSPGSALATISAEGNLQIEYTLPSQYLTMAKIGQAITFIASGQQNPNPGHVVYVAPQLDSNSSLKLRANFSHPVNLLANQFGQVKQVINPNHRSLMVTQNLVQTDSGGFYVYGVQYGKVVKYYFQPGALTAQGMLEVRGGIKQGTKIINNKIGDLSVGQQVKVIAP